MSVARPAVALTVLLITAMAAVGCGRSASTPPQSTPQVIRAGQSDNHHSVHLTVGDRLVVSLANTYWSFVPNGSPAVLRAGTPQTRSVPLGSTSGCVPGQGCGTVTEIFTARAAGRTQVRASRTTCGEAMLCRPDQRSFVLNVIVD